MRSFFKKDDIFGLTDSDNKTSQEKESLNKSNIFSIPLAQHEHLFIIP